MVMTSPKAIQRLQTTVRVQSSEQTSAPAYRKSAPPTSEIKRASDTFRIKYAAQASLHEATEKQAQARKEAGNGDMMARKKPTEEGTAWL
jgi:hypothetical protein